MLTWEKIYSTSALYKAALKVYTKSLFQSRKARAKSVDDVNLYDYASHTRQNLKKLNKSLANKSFHFRCGYKKTYKLKGKTRAIYVYPWEEKIVDTLVFDELDKRLNNFFSPYSYAYRSINKGINSCQSCLKRKLQKKSFYIIKRDVSNYFPSIDHKILIGELEKYFSGYLFELLKERVSFKYMEDTSSFEEIAQCGVPFGTPIACFFANLYLTPIDKYFEKKNVYYFRYADDFLLLCKSKEQALRTVADFDNMIKERKLFLKPSHKKHFAFNIEGDELFESVKSFDFLGLTFTDKGCRLGKVKKHKLQNLFRFAFRRKKMRKIKDPIERAQILVDVTSKVIEDGMRSVAIIDYYLSHIDDEKQLKMLDRWLAEEILAQALQTGHKKGNFRKISFKQLRNMGLKSLCHRHRLLKHRHISSSFFVLRNKNLSEKRYFVKRKKAVQFNKK